MSRASDRRDQGERFAVKIAAGGLREGALEQVRAQLQAQGHRLDQAEIRTDGNWIAARDLSRREAQKLRRSLKGLGLESEALRADELVAATELAAKADGDSAVSPGVDGRIESDPWDTVAKRHTIAGMPAISPDEADADAAGGWSGLLSPPSPTDDVEDDLDPGHEPSGLYSPLDWFGQQAHDGALEIDSSGPEHSDRDSFEPDTFGSGSSGPRSRRASEPNFDGDTGPRFPSLPSSDIPLAEDDEFPLLDAFGSEAKRGSPQPPSSVNTGAHATAVRPAPVRQDAFESAISAAAKRPKSRAPSSGRPVYGEDQREPLSRNTRIAVLAAVGILAGIGLLIFLLTYNSTPEVDPGSREEAREALAEQPRREAAEGTAPSTTPVPTRQELAERKAKKREGEKRLASEAAGAESADEVTGEDPGADAETALELLEDGKALCDAERWAECEATLQAAITMDPTLREAYAVILDAQRAQQGDVDVDEAPEIGRDGTAPVGEGQGDRSGRAAEPGPIDPRQDRQDAGGGSSVTVIAPPSPGEDEGGPDNPGTSAIPPVPIEEKLPVGDPGAGESGSDNSGETGDGDGSEEDERQFQVKEKTEGGVMVLTPE